VEIATPNYFTTLNIALRDGRLLSDTDGAESPQVRGDQRKSGEALFSGEKSAGHHNQRPQSGRPKAKWITVVGVVNDVRYSWIVKEDVPTITVRFRAGASVLHNRGATHGR